MRSKSIDLTSRLGLHGIGDVGVLRTVLLDLSKARLRPFPTAEARKGW